MKSSKTTFEDLLDTLKELEAEPPELKEPRKSFKDAWGMSFNCTLLRCISNAGFINHKRFSLDNFTPAQKFDSLMVYRIQQIFQVRIHRITLYLRFQLPFVCFLA